MVDVTDKAATVRIAVAEAFVTMQANTLRLILNGEIEKGEVFAVARIAGIQAAKKCSDLIPLCHPLMLSSVKVDFEAVSDTCIRVQARVKLSGKTGVEMEALTAASIASLTIYDMCKAVEKGIQIERLALVSKSGGKSGDWGAT